MEESLQNCFVSLVGEARFEPALFDLFQQDPAEWSDLASIMPDEQIEPRTSFVTWLPDPVAKSEGFRLVLFHDTSTGATQAACYNFTRLLRGFEGADQV